MLFLYSCENSNHNRFYPMSNLKSGMCEAEVKKVMNEYASQGVVDKKRGIFRINEKIYFFKLKYCKTLFFNRLEGIGLHSYGEEFLLYDQIINTNPEMEDINVELVEYLYPDIFKPDSIVWLFSNKLHIDDFNTLSCN